VPLNQEIVVKLDPMLSVNELVLRYPAALPVLTAAGIDTCCGGDLTLMAAAQGRGLSLEQLEARLQQDSAALQSERPAAADCGCGCKAS
jgi:iron-sulfur cluster repair protein YtfE (RIC family)